jgi:hypothetical protein
MNIIIRIFFITLFLFSNHSFTTPFPSIRCDGKILNIGHSRYEIEHYCGKPSSVVKIYKEITVHRRWAVLNSEDKEKRIEYDRFTTVNSSGKKLKEKYSEKKSKKKKYNHGHSKLLKNYNILKNHKDKDKKKIKRIREIYNIKTSSIDREEITEISKENLVNALWEWECTTKNMLVEKIIYNFGGNKFLYFLVYNDGTLVSIETGERGFDEVPSVE